MTIDEAIKHCEETAHQNEILMKRYDDASGYSRSHNEQIRTSGAIGCESLVDTYRQLAEWLKELKAWREAEIVQMATDNTKTLIFNEERVSDKECQE